jgi:hypothetical protein
MQSGPCKSKLLIVKKYLFERTRRRKIAKQFSDGAGSSEFIILRIPMTEKWPFWFWTDTGDNIFFSVGNQFLLLYNFNTTTHGAH